MDSGFCSFLLSDSSFVMMICTFVRVRCVVSDGICVDCIFRSLIWSVICFVEQFMQSYWSFDLFESLFCFFHALFVQVLKPFCEIFFKIKKMNRNLRKISKKLPQSAKNHKFFDLRFQERPISQCTWWFDDFIGHRWT